MEIKNDKSKEIPDADEDRFNVLLEAMASGKLEAKDQTSKPAARDNAGHQVATTLDHAKHDGLVILTALVLAADESLVGLDNAIAAQRSVTINRSHVLADFVAHAPRSLVCHAQLALEFLGRDAMARGREQVHGIEPLAQRRVRTVKRGAHHRVNVMAATRGRAAESRLIPQTDKAARLAAFWAFRAAAVADLHQMLQTRIVVREAGRKVLKGEGLSHG